MINVHFLLTEEFLGYPKSDMRYPHVVLMEHRSNPLLISHRTRISRLGVGLRRLEEKRKEDFMGLANLFQNIRVQKKAYQLLPLLIQRTSQTLGNNFHET